MTTLHQNAPIHQLTKNLIAMIQTPASLQMMTQDYYPINSEEEKEYLTL